MIFEYQALNKSGKTITDLVDASTEQSARQKLRAQGLYVVRITAHDVVSNKAGSSNSSFFISSYNKIVDYFAFKASAKQVGIFSRQLSTLLNAGMPLLTAIQDILEQLESQHFKRIIADIKEKLEEGSSFSNCLGRHRAIFSDMYINMVRVGENLGSLDQVIERLAELEEKRSILKSKVGAALWYPSFMVFFAIIVVVFLMVKIIPTLSIMFLDLGHDLPMPTRIVMGISNFLSSYWLIMLLVLSIAFYFFRKYIQTDEGHRKLDEWKMQLPVVSKLYKKLVVLKFTQNLGVLLNNKVDIIKSLEIVKKLVENVIVEEKIEEAARMIKEGTPISKALAKADFLPKLVLGMISAGEASDKLDIMLLNIGKVYETEIDLTINSLTSLIEPVIIVFMGLVIGTIVVAVMLPILEMNLIVQ